MGKPSSSCFQGLPCLSTGDVWTGILTSANGGHETRVTEALTDAPLREEGFCLQTSSPVPYCLVPAGKIGDTLNAFLLNSIMEQVSRVRKPALWKPRIRSQIPIHLSQLSLCLQSVISPVTRQSARPRCYCTATSSGSNRNPNKRRSFLDDKIAFRVYWMNSGRAANKSREI